MKRLSFQETSWYKKWGAVIVLISTLSASIAYQSAYAGTELTKEQVKQCSYISGVARSIQGIRQETNHSFVQFTREVDKMYKRGDGLNIIKRIGYEVYTKVGKEVTPEETFTSLYDHCIKEKRIANVEEYY